MEGVVLGEASAFIGKGSVIEIYEVYPKSNIYGYLINYKGRKIQQSSAPAISGNLPMNREQAMRMAELVLGKLEMDLYDTPHLSWSEVDAILDSQATPLEILNHAAKQHGLI